MLWASVSACIHRNSAQHTTGYLVQLRSMTAQQSRGLQFMYTLTPCTDPHKKKAFCHVFTNQRQTNTNSTWVWPFSLPVRGSHELSRFRYRWNTLLCVFLAFILWPSDKLITLLLALCSLLLQRSARLSQHWLYDCWLLCRLDNRYDLKFTAMARY